MKGVLATTPSKFAAVLSNKSEDGCSVSLDSVQDVFDSPEESIAMIPQEIVQQRLKAFYHMKKKSVLRRKIDQRSRLIKDNKIKNYDKLDMYLMARVDSDSSSECYLSEAEERASK